VKAGIVLVGPESGSIVTSLALRYNSETLTGSLAVQAVGEEAS